MDDVATIAEVREMLGDEAIGRTDEEIRAFRDRGYELAEIVYRNRHALLAQMGQPRPTWPVATEPTFMPKRRRRRGGRAKR